LLANEQIVLWALFLGGIFLIIFEMVYKPERAKIEDLSHISYKHSFFIGIFQSIAIIPGVSRAAATIIGGLALGLKRRTIVEFSFLLAVPTMAAATFYDLVKSSNDFSWDQAGILLIGFLISFFVAILAVKFLLYFIRRNNFIPFGVYRIILAILFWFVVF